MSMEVKAKYLGDNGYGGYRVNVRTAHPTGKIGDAGFVRTFRSEEEAKMYAKLVNETGEDVFVKKTEKENPNVRHEGEDFVSKDKQVEEKQCPTISWTQAAFNLLNDEQIKSINETRRLPEGVKIVKDVNGNFKLTNNYMNFTPGTRTVPEGYEFKKDWLGFTVIVPKDTESILIKDVA